MADQSQEGEMARRGKRKKKEGETPKPGREVAVQSKPRSLMERLKLVGPIASSDDRPMKRA